MPSASASAFGIFSLFTYSMNWPNRSWLFFAALLIVSAAIHGAHGDAMVSGTVYCDQCKDGQVSLFDYPIYGIKVSMSCPGTDGQLTMLKEETTNWVGGYVMKIEGSPDLRGCHAQVSGSGQGSMSCGAVAGPPQSLRLVFSMFDTEIYTVDPLISQPAQPMSYCPRSASPVPVPVTPSLPPPVTPALPPPTPISRPPVPRLPPMPQLPPLPPLPPMVPVPFFQPSACPYKTWTMPEYQCHWKVLSPDTKVAVVFGLLAAKRYGTDVSLWQSMRGRGDPYKTLLREGTTALLNSYNSIQYPYHPLDVVTRLNWALMGSTRQVLVTALKFMRANSGNYGNMTCRLTTCK